MSMISNSNSRRRLIKAASSSELLNADLETDTVYSPTNGFASRVKHFLGYGSGSSPLTSLRKRARSLNIIDRDATFGVPLDNLLSRLPTVGEGKVPLFVSQIISFIEEQGLEQEGIYRVNGNAKLMETLRAKIDKIGEVDLNCTDVYSAGGLLKLFLRELPESLIPDAAIDSIVELQEVAKEGTTDSDASEKLKAILQTIPSSSYNLLKYLCRHLHTVAQYSEENKMTAVSLSIVFGPNVLRCGGGLDGLKRQGYANSAFSQMIQNCREIFEIGDLTFTPTLSSTPIKRAPPDHPKPFHVHMATKKHWDNEALSRSLPCSPTKFSSREEDSYHERSIDEAVCQSLTNIEDESGERNGINNDNRDQQQPKKVKLISSTCSSDDQLTTRIPSPQSWRSSTGTSPSSSPLLTPRTSEVYTTMIGETVQDLLFNQDKVISTSASETTTTTTTSSTSQPYRILSESESSSTQVPESSSSSMHVQLRQDMLRRKKLSVRNRKSVVHEGVLSERGDQQTNSQIDDSTVESASIEVTQDAIEKMRERKQPSIIDETDRRESENNLRVNELDYVRREAGALFHPTLQRVRGPRNRTRPRKKHAHAIPHQPINSSVEDLIKLRSEDNIVTKPLDTALADNVVSSPHDMPLLLQSSLIDESSPSKPSGFDVSLRTRLIPTDVAPEDSTRARNGWLEYRSSNDQQKAVIAELTKQAQEKRPNPLEGTADGGGQLSSLSAVHMDEELSPGLHRKPAAIGGGGRVQRHQSLYIPTEHQYITDDVDTAAKSSSNQLLPVLQRMLKLLADKRVKEERPEEISKMNYQQLKEEKYAVQKSLLSFERKYGRPQAPEDKEVMRPIYNRYRSIKQAFSSTSETKDWQTNNSLPAADSTCPSVSLLQHSSLATSLPLPVGGGGSTTIPPSSQEGAPLILPNHKQSAVPKPKPRKSSSLSGTSSDSLMAEFRRTSTGSLRRHWMSDDELIEAPYTDLQQQLLLTHERRKELRAILREFETEFYKTHDRKIEKEDKKPLTEQYVKYKEVKVRLALLKTLINKHSHETV